MATNKENIEVKNEVDNAKIVEDHYNELVPYTAFYDGDKYKDDITVGVNGKIWRIQRGVEVMIPRYVRDVIDATDRQNRSAADMRIAAQNEYINAARASGV